MAKLLVIGGSGFFGKSILSAFKRNLLRDWRVKSVFVIARHASLLKIQYPELIIEGVEMLDLDIGAATALPDADYIIHAAASTNAINYLSHSKVAKDNIQEATYNFCRLMRDKKSTPKIVYASSGAVYGQQEQDVPALSELTPFRPVDCMALNKRDYALAKRDAENAITELGLEDFPVSIARCFAFVGHYLPRDQHFAIGNFIGDGLMGSIIKVRATKPVYRSYMHADDLVRWLMTIAAASDPECPIYNVGSGEAVEIRELAKKVANYFGIDVGATELTSADADRYIPSVEKAFRELGLTSQYDLSASISKTVKQIQSS